MFLNDLKNRGLPPVIPSGLAAGEWAAHRARIIDLFSEQVYGFTPPAPAAVKAEIVSTDDGECAGKADHTEIRLSFETPNGLFSFPADFAIPAGPGPHPLFIYISFRPYIECGNYRPLEEIIDGGWAIASFYYNDVAFDGEDGFGGGIAAKYPRGAPSGKPGADWGKISMWAFAASRVMDYALTLERIDAGKIYAVGHSRLGKTALWCAAQDGRFAGAGANNSGCSGAAISRGKKGETIDDITGRFPYWFCENYRQYAGREPEAPFDQHMLAASLAPRKLAVCGAEEDIWADPASEYMSVYEADKAYRLLGVKGFSGPAEYPEVGAEFADGNLGYMLRPGKHFFSRQDWRFYMSFFA